MCWGVGVTFLQQQLELKPCPDSKPRAVPLLSRDAPTGPDQTEAWSPGVGLSYIFFQFSLVQWLSHV